MAAAEEEAQAAQVEVVRLPPNYWPLPAPCHAGQLWLCSICNGGLIPASTPVDTGSSSKRVGRAHWRAPNCQPMHP